MKKIKDNYKPAFDMKSSFQYNIILILTLLSFQVGVAQDGDGTNNVGLQRLFNDKQHVVPPSAEPASLGKYGEYQINMYTGAPSISVPIYTISGSELSMNVSLSYNAQGNKVADLPGWVGTGWSLSAGGVISRAVKAEPDLKLNYFDYAEELMRRVNTQEDQISEYDFFYKVASTEIESQPDEFHFSFNGRSGKFYISPNAMQSAPDEDGNVELINHTDITLDNEDRGIYMREYQDIRVEPTFDVLSGDVIEFVIIDENGTKYFYQTTERTRIEHSDEFGGDIGLTRKSHNLIREYNSSWYLSKVESKNRNETLTLKYANVTDFYSLPFNVEQSKFNSFSIKDDGEGPKEVTEVLGEGSPGPKSEVLGKKYLTSIEHKFRNTQTEKLNFDSKPVKASDMLLPDSDDCEILNESERRLNRIRLSRLNQSTGVSWELKYNCAEIGRLALEKVQQRGGSDEIEPYEFEYNNIKLPTYYSTEIDHWGFYNGTGGLLPEFDVETAVIDVSARLPNPINMQAGILNKITYPTKGSTVFEYESHTTTEIPDESNFVVAKAAGGGNLYNVTTCSFNRSCCVDDPETQDQYMRITRSTSDVVASQEHISTGKITLTAIFTCLDAEAFPNGGDDQDFRGEIEIYDGGNNLVLRRELVNSDNNISELTVDIDISSVLSPGCYRIQLLGVQAQVNAVWKVIGPAEPVTITQGGLRIKSIKSFDSDGDPLLHKGYEYTIGDDPKISTGIVLRNPSYVNVTMNTTYPLISLGSSIENVVNIENINIGTTSISELGTIQGSNVGYGRVREIIYNDGTTATNEGYTDSYFYNKNLSEDRLDPVLNGQLLKQITYDRDGRALKQSDHEYSFTTDNGHKRGELFYGYVIKPTMVQDNKDFLIRVVTPPVNPAMPDDPVDRDTTYLWSQNLNDSVHEFGVYDVFVFKSNMERSNFAQHEQVYIHPTQVVETYFYHLDGDDEPDRQISTVTDMEYTSPDHLQVTAQSILNSNGKIYRTEYAYPQDQSGGIIDELKNKHIVQSIESVKKVDGVIVDGSKTDWDLFNSQLYPRVISRKEVTWDEGGAYVSPVLTPQVTINAYDADIGKPTSITQYGWKDPSEYVWTTSGKLSSASFLEFETVYDYNSQNQLSKVTNIDETVMTYQYDGLLRLKLATDMCRQAKTIIDYQYKGDTHPENAILSTKSFPQFGEELAAQDIVTKAIFDGLGRSIQTIQLNQAPNPTEHIIVSTEYDGVGRPFKQYEPNTSTTDTYNEPTGSYTLTEYEPSPLNRTIKVTPPNWNYPTITEYGVNEANVITNYHQTPAEGSTNVAEGLLHLTRTIDPNGNIAEMYSDKVGREILSRRLDENGALPNDTYKIYDDKDRVNTIVPPDATLLTPGLLFSYVYLEDDLVSKKTLPDREPEEYLYNSRHQLVYRQEGNMRDEGHSYTTKYDDYGRMLQEGFSPVNITNQLKIDAAQQPSGATYVNETIDQVLITNTYVPEADQHKDKLLSSSAALLLDLGNSITTSYVYDPCGRMLQQTGNTILSLGDLESHKTTFVYDAADQVIASYDETPNLAKSLTIANFMQYDHNGRLTGEAIQIADKEAIQLSNIEYTPKEQIHKLYQGGSASPLQICDYNYLDNRFLKSMNDPKSRGDDLFAMELFYDQQNPLLAAPSVRKNGDIIAQQWSTAKDPIVEGPSPSEDPSTVVVYGYDYLNRIKSSTHIDEDRYNTTYNYDPRGNIDTLIRAGGRIDQEVVNYEAIDDMAYEYIPGTNKINTITDATNSVEGFKGANATSYVYDKNGNITSDPGNALEIAYSHLNLPDEIVVPDSNGIVRYFYTADGALQKKETIRDNNIDQTRQYISAYEYLDDTLYQINTSQGYILMNPEGLEELPDEGAPEVIADYPGATTCLLVTPVSAPEEELEPFLAATGDIFYSIKDHLGNTRITYSDKDRDRNIIAATEVVQEHHYYPFGLEMNGVWTLNSSKDYNYRYNGKELQTELDIGYYNYGARFYDPSIGRFTGVDPISDQFVYLSTFNYASNSPIVNLDLWGLQGKNFNSVDVGNMKSYFNENVRNRNLGKGDDCMTCHIKGVEILTNNTIPKGDNSDGMNNISRQRKGMQDEGLAGNTLSVSYNDANGNKAIDADRADSMNGSVGELLAEESKGTENSVFGVSMGDGYHVMTITVTNTPVNGPVNPGDDPLTQTTYTLSDQGPGTSGYGNREYDNSSDLDGRLTRYIKNDVPGAFPATIELHQILNPDE